MTNLTNLELLEKANALRQESFANKINLCSIINAKSGNCSMDCAFCAQSKHNQIASQNSNQHSNQHTIASFPFLDLAILKDKIINLAKLPIAHIGIVTSGAALSDHEVDSFCLLLSELPELCRNKVCASFGRLSLNNLQKLAKAGLKRFHHNLETARNFYPKICTSQTWDSRAKTLELAKEAGLEVCSGGLFGMGETWQDRLDFAKSLAELEIEHIPLNFLYPQKNTPLAKRGFLATTEALEIIANFRQILPKATLRICGGRVETFKEQQKQIFFAGANALMTGDYLTTAGANLKDDLIMLAELGLESDAS